MSVLHQLARTRARRIAWLGAHAVLAASVLGLATPSSAVAHPLGNFTVNRYNGLTVANTWIHLDRVVDMAELPTVEARREIDADRDGLASDAESARWAEERCRSAVGELSLSVGTLPVALAPSGVGLTFPPGQAGLATLRLVCTYRGDYPSNPASSVVRFVDTSFASRQGWREIVVRAAGVSLVGAEPFARGSSERLRAYPTDPGAALRADTAAQFAFTPAAGSAAAPPPIVDDAVALGAAPADIVGSSPAAAVRPGGVEDLPSEIAALIQAQELSAAAVMLALVVAVLVGAFHAATPGHGKALMAAYLVGARGTVRHAVGLGMTVTVAHTIGVLVLGAVVMLAGAALPSERLLPLLGFASGIIVTLLGGALLLQRIRAARQARSVGHGHGHGHDHDELRSSAGADAVAAADGGGWHAHGGLRHTHLPAANTIRRRDLLALGLVGGLVPSASAILILVGSIAAGRPAFGMLLTVAFGAGMATVLVGVGVLLVKARSLLERLPSAGIQRLVAYAPLATAIVFLLAGTAITIEAGSRLR